MRYKAAALFLSIIAMAMIAAHLLDFSVFPLGAPASSPDPIASVADWLWSYRTIDVLIQGVLLLAAVMGASAMFRMRHTEEDV